MGLVLMFTIFGRLASVTGHIRAISSQTLEYLYLCNIKLQGNIPQSFFTLVNLTEICLSSNNFSGFFFTDGNYDFSRLERLYLSSMGLTEFPKLSGKVPNSIDLDLSNNKFNGTVPEWLHEMVSLQSLYLSQNLLIGGISSSICNASSMEFSTFLRANKLHGPIVNLETEHQFPSLIVFDISSNNFNGLPKAYIQNFEAMKNVIQEVENRLQEYIDIGNSTGIDSIIDHEIVSATLTTKAMSMTFNQIPINLVAIDLSSNKFEGEIPTVIRELNALKALNLSHTDSVVQYRNP
ncbi:unnamed protein product [Sphenostylis stenocarpa]|uniref:Uncharacterized protein n=1 Tax=Sphenostylis stenocarpa TaxID=92480 RepID=A0AA86VS29_9FABA|nr:unnamed protein product [Sphenostylis stenocarpa]